MAQPAAKQYDESLINFYEEHLVGHADTLYRFAFALTLSLDGAAQCVRKTYKDVSGKLENLHGGGEPNVALVLISECWKAFAAMKGQKFTEGQSAVTRALKPIPLEGRAAMVAVDVAGLSPAEAAKALGWGEKDLRHKLAEARRSLMMSTLDV